MPLMSAEAVVALLLLWLLLSWLLLWSFFVMIFFGMVLFAMMLFAKASSAGQKDVDDIINLKDGNKK